MKKRVYIAGPYTKGDVAVNVKTALVAANFLADNGFAPFVPHLTHFWHLCFPRSYESWIEIDNCFVVVCDALLRLPGESTGADKEVALAEEKNIPVFHSFAALFEYFQKLATGHIDDQVLAIVRASNAPVSFPAIEERLNGDSFDVRDAVWRLVGQKKLAFTPRRYIQAIGEW